MAVSNEIAVDEVSKWLDFKNVSEKRRESKKDSIDGLIECIEDGSIIINEDFTLLHKLSNPINKEIKTDSISYAPKLSVGKIQQHMQGVKSDDITGMIIAYGAALTGKPKEFIKALDTEDYSILSKVAIFFM